MKQKIGQTIGKYQLIERVGQGGMAEVYKAYQPSLSRDVAIKVMHNHLADDPDFITRFEREATAVARLRHPNIVRVYDFDIEDGVYYMVMEYIEGATLKGDIATRQQQRPGNGSNSTPNDPAAFAPNSPNYTFHEIAYIISTLASALDYAHAQGIIHRDLKPANIMFTREGQIVLTDFGLVRLVDKPSQTMTGLVTGTPAYMSPEQAQGEEIQATSDIYSLGVILYEVLTGRPPYHAESAFSIMMKQVSAAPIHYIDDSKIPEEVNGILQKALAYTPEERFQSAGELAAELRQALGLTLDDLAKLSRGGDFTISSGTTAQKADTPSKILAACPYQGLFAFREDDAQFFFGREEFTDKLTTIVENQYLTPLIGPSGSGKSSVIFAGLVPRLRQQADWLVCDLRPGTQPFNSLAAALLPLLEPQISEIDRLVETRRFAQQLEHQVTHLNSIINRILERHDYFNHLLIIIDQFEELYTLCGNADTRERFLDLLTATHLGDTFRIVLTLRADFLGSALGHPRFAAIIQNTPLILGPMYREELTQAVEKPAEIQGVSFEVGLVDRIIDDVSFEPGNLPLLEFALTTLWAKQEQGQLTHKAYDEIGRVIGALARHADSVYATLSAEQKDVARSIFIQMVRPGDNTEDTRRLATRQEIGEERWQLVRKLADARLVVTNQDPEENETAEIVHEALIRSWERLRNWMDGDRTFRLWQERLRASLRQWVENEEDPGALLRGAPLTEAADWLQRRPQAINEQETAFIEASVELSERQEREKSRTRRRTMIGLVGGLAIMIVLTIVSLFQLTRANQARAEVVIERDQAQISLSRQLAVQSLSLQAQQLDVSLLLAVAAGQTADTLDARNTLLAGLAANNRIITFLRGTDIPIRYIAHSEGGELYASSGISGTVVLYNAVSHDIVNLVPHIGSIRDLALSPNGRLLAIANGSGVSLWDTDTLEQIAQLERDSNPPEATIQFANDNNLLAVGYADGLVIMWDVAERTAAYELQGHTRQITDVAFSRDGRLMATGSLDQTAVIWDLRNQEPYVEPLVGHTNTIWAVDFHPDNTRLATASQDGTIRFWNTANGLQTRNVLENPSGEWITSIDYNNDGLLLASGTRDNQIIFWDTARETEDANLGTVNGHKDIVWDVLFTNNGQQLISGSTDGQFIVWNTEVLPRIGPLMMAPLDDHNDRVRDLTYISAGDLLVSADEAGAVIFWDLTQTPPAGRPFFTGTAVNAVASSSDGQRLAAAAANGSVILWDVPLQRLLETPLQGHEAAVNAVAFSADNKLLASGDENGIIIIWDMSTLEQLSQPLSADPHAIGSLTFTNDGSYLLAGDEEGDIIVWNLDNPNTGGRIIRAHNSAITRLRLSPDNQLLASAGEDRSILLWNTADILNYDPATSPLPKPDGAPLAGHERRINALAFSPDGQTLASGSDGTVFRTGEIGNDDDIIILWDVETRQQIGPALQSRHGRVYTVEFSPDGNTLVSGGWDKNILFWEMNPEGWQTIACERTNREFTEAEWEQFIGVGEPQPLCAE